MIKSYKHFKNIFFLLFILKNLKSFIWIQLYLINSKRINNLNSKIYIYNKTSCSLKLIIDF